MRNRLIKSKDLLAVIANLIQRLCLHSINLYSASYMKSFKPLAIFRSRTVLFLLNPVENPENRFS